jgi:hypothetical protein
MAVREITEEDYFATLDDNLNCGVGGTATGAYDLVATQAEFARFKRALLRWLEAAEDEWDDIARNEELGIEP